MSTEIKQVNVQLAFIDCECTNFGLTEFGINNIDKIPFDKYNFGFNVNVDINESYKTVSININSSLQELDPPTRIIAEITAKNVFKIVNFDQIITKSNDRFVAPNELLVPLFGICISTLRGMYSTKLQGSNYSNAVLPLIDPSQIIPKNTPALG